jgi:thiamine biosynthesis lipoprotein
MAGVTVICPDATQSDALSTGLFVLGMEASLKVIRELPGVEALFIPDRDPIEIWVTPGMERAFIPLPEFVPSVRRIRFVDR